MLSHPVSHRATSTGGCCCCLRCAAELLMDGNSDRPLLLVRIVDVPAAASVPAPTAGIPWPARVCRPAGTAGTAAEQTNSCGRFCAR
jgi:hypothetical protein